MRGVTTLGLLALIAACGGNPPMSCSGDPEPCSPLWEDCLGSATRCLSADTGADRAWVEIESAPTPAAIYLDDRFIGYTPLRYAMSFTSTQGSLKLVAVPLYAGQAQQERSIIVPPLPERVSFFMNNAPGASIGSTNDGDQPD